MTNEEKLKYLDAYHIKRFWSKIYIPENDNDCWDWIGNTDKDGYGLLSFHNFNLRAHRVSLYLDGKGNGNGLVAMHICDRPVCCNPKHLKWGTNIDNIIDRDLKKRGRGPSGSESGRFTMPEKNARGENHGRAKLTETMVLEMQKLFIDGVMVKDIASKFNINKSHACQIIKGNRWTHIKNDKCKINASISIPDSTIIRIRELYSGGFSQAEISRILDINSKTINKIVNNQRRKILLNIENQ